MKPRMEASTGVQHGDATRADDAPACVCVGGGGTHDFGRRREFC